MYRAENGNNNPYSSNTPKPLHGRKRAGGKMKTTLVVWLAFANFPDYYQEFPKESEGICITAKLRILRAWIDKEGVEIKKLECE